MDADADGQKRRAPNEIDDGKGQQNFVRLAACGGWHGRLPVPVTLAILRCGCSVERLTHSPRHNPFWRDAISSTADIRRAAPIVVEALLAAPFNAELSLARNLATSVGGKMSRQGSSSL